jgi:hypothetical protein
LTYAEKEKVKQMRDQELGRYKRNVSEIFDSDKNWSIMISREDNEIRNNVMRKVKFEQIKRQKLRNFMREAKEKVLNQRAPVDVDFEAG